MAGSYLRLTDFVYHSTLGLRVIKQKNKVWGSGFSAPAFVAALSGVSLGLVSALANLAAVVASHCSVAVLACFVPAGSAPPSAAADFALPLVPLAGAGGWGLGFTVQGSGFRG